MATSIKASPEAIGKYERCESIPSIETAEKIADLFEVTLDCLVDDSAVASFDTNFETLKGDPAPQ